jgi:1L-myo-inositol 1-phosphate cytidylyltransferase
MTVEALIIAAGEGSRLRSASNCKPLTLVNGISLLELGIRQLVAAGIKRVVVAVGYQAELIEAELPNLACKTGVELVSVRVGEWIKPNGHSVIAGANLIEGNYLLVMADHIFSDGVLPALIQYGAPDVGVTLLVDHRMNSPLIDPDDATFVRCDEGGLITHIGKHLTLPDAVDCGAFFATPALAKAIAEAIAAGQSGSLSQGMQFLANQHRAATCDIGNAWWLDVDDPRALALAEAEAAEWLTEAFVTDGANLKASFAV